jgi:hypothetical protein
MSGSRGGDGMGPDIEDMIAGVDVAIVSELAVEPSYLSEIARKAQALSLPYGYDQNELDEAIAIDNTWDGISFENALTTVMLGVTILSDDMGDAFLIDQYNYDVADSGSIGESQSVGSIHDVITDETTGVSQEWNPYTVIKTESAGIVGDVMTNNGFGGVAGQMRQAVDPTVTMDEKINQIEQVSRGGNTESIQAERIMQDVMNRQFQEYDRTDSPGYNSPKPDFIVADEKKRDYGLIVEISTRHVNPIREVYVDTKQSLALDFEEDEEGDIAYDLVVLAPRFGNAIWRQYEGGDNWDNHPEPTDSMVHLHYVPSKQPDVYRPFATSPDGIEQPATDGDGGNPIIVPDSERLESQIEQSGQIAGEYPIVDATKQDLLELLDGFNRDYQTITESRYRNQIREAIEPLLPNFLRPYKIEQYLVEMYWDKGLTQSEVGELVDVTGSTIGSWMRTFGVLRRGTGAPTLSSEVKEIWRRMYNGEEPFQSQFSGYRIQAEYNRHPLWDLSDWRDWYRDTTEDERQEVVRQQSSFRDELDYTVLVGAADRLLPSYSFILSTLKDMDVEIRAPDEAPRVPYNAYPSEDALEYMINTDETTIVDVTDET